MIKIPTSLITKQFIKFNAETNDFLMFVHGQYHPTTKFFTYLRFISAQGEVYEVGSLREGERVLKIKNLVDEIPICLNSKCSKLTSKALSPHLQKNSSIWGRESSKWGFPA